MSEPMKPSARTRYRQRHPDRVKKTARSWVERHRDRALAQWTVQRAVRRGLLTRPDTCSQCGASGLIEGSHDDYSKPLDVQWLCVLCHRRKDASTRPRKHKTRAFDSEGRWQCARCKEWLPLQTFNKSKARLSGYSYYCKLCEKQFPSKATAALAQANAALGAGGERP